MKITLEHYNTKHTVEIDRDDLTIDEVLEELVEPVMQSAGYHIRYGEIQHVPREEQ
jgi:hypothetical protein